MSTSTLIKTTLLAAAVSAVLTLHAQAQAPGGALPGMGAPAGAEQEEANPPVIDSFTYAGNKKITTAGLSKDSTMKTGVKITKAMVGGEIERIIALYKKAGYDLAISPDIQHPADGHVTVTFKIDENGKGGNAGPVAGGAGGPPPSDAGGPPPSK